MRRCNFTLSIDYLRELLDLTRLERFERFVFVRLEPRRLEPPAAGGAAGGAAAGAAAGAGALAAAALPKPKRLDIEFNKLPLEPVDISTLSQ